MELCLWPAGDPSDLVFWCHRLPNDLFSFLGASSRGEPGPGVGHFLLIDVLAVVPASLSITWSLHSDPNVLVINCLVSRTSGSVSSGNGQATEKCPGQLDWMGFILGPLACFSVRLPACPPHTRPGLRLLLVFRARSRRGLGGDMTGASSGGRRDRGSVPLGRLGLEGPRAETPAPPGGPLPPPRSGAVGKCMSVPGP